MMKALVWHGTHDVRVDSAPEPKIHLQTDVIVQITSTAICGSDLHLYDGMMPTMEEGDILSHEPMGIVEFPRPSRDLLAANPSDTKSVEEFAAKKAFDEATTAFLDRWTINLLRGAGD
jgi:Alcohol dehydrogenase GroES-associated/Alcohol dehydrogenase GroES-like domain